MSKTRADILPTLGMPNRLRPIRRTIRRAVMEPRGISTVHSAPRSGRCEVLVDWSAIHADGSVAEQPDPITEEGSDGHNPDRHQSP
jgi:hypothetical protein